MVKTVANGAISPAQVSDILAQHGFTGRDEDALLVVSRRTAAVLWANASALTRLDAIDHDALQRRLFGTPAGRTYAGRLGRATARGAYRLERLALAGQATPTIVASYAVEGDEPMALLHVRGVGSLSSPGSVAADPVPEQAARAAPIGPEPAAVPIRILWETDAAGILTRIGPDAPLLGAQAPKLGDDLPAAIRAFAPDVADRLLAAAAQQGSVAVSRVAWPQDGADVTRGVDLGATVRRGSAPGLRGFFVVHGVPREAEVDAARLASPESQAPLPVADDAEAVAPKLPVAPPAEAEAAATGSPSGVPPSPPVDPEAPSRGNVVHFPVMRLGPIPAKFGTALQPIPTAAAAPLADPAELTIPHWSEAPAPPAAADPGFDSLSADERDAFEHIRKVLGTRPFAQPSASKPESVGPAFQAAMPTGLPQLLDHVPVPLRLEMRGFAHANTAWRERQSAESRQDSAPQAADTASFDLAGLPAVLTMLPPASANPRQADAATAEALDLATDGHLRLDETGALAAISPKAARLLGLDARSALGRAFTSLLGEGQAPAWQALVATVTGASPQGPTPLRLRNVAGQPVPVQLRLGRSDGALLCSLTLDRQAPANDSAEVARREAERTSALKSEFLAKVSHEIRTPLNAILGFAEVIRDERLGPVGNARYLEYLRDIHASGTHVMSLVNDLLDLSRIEAGRMDLNLAAVDANGIVQSCVNTLQTLAHGERVIVRLSLTPHLPATLADERSLRQIVLNLLSNAIKFNEPGGQVIVSTALVGSHAVAIRIRDTGIGMSEDEIETAMEPFRQVSTVNRTGSGLGLPLTKALVEANCASMAIKSARGEGTLVEITFPLVESDPMSLPAE